MTDTNDLQEETEYTYYYADGQCGRIKLGRDGIEKQSIINMLYEMDEETEKIENREDNAKCKKFQYQMAEKISQKKKIQIQDKSADRFKIDLRKK